MCLLVRTTLARIHGLRDAAVDVITKMQVVQWFVVHNCHGSGNI